MDRAVVNHPQATLGDKEGLEDEKTDEEEDAPEDSDDSESAMKKTSRKHKRSTCFMPKKLGKSKKKQKQMEHTREEVMADYSDCELPAWKGHGGHKAADILDELSVYICRKSDPDLAARVYRCIAAEHECCYNGEYSPCQILSTPHLHLPFLRLDHLIAKAQDLKTM